jgi:hypothetical protein
MLDGCALIFTLSNTRPLWSRPVLILSLALVATTAVLVALFNNDADDASRLVINNYVQLTLRSNPQVAGLEYAYFSLSNRTADPISYIGDRNMEPLASVIEERFDSNIRRLRRTNHSLTRLRQTRMATLPAHSAVDFMVYYPTDLTNAALVLSYLPAKTHFGRAAENLKLQVAGKPAKPTNQFDSIELELPFRRK